MKVLVPLLAVQVVLATGHLHAQGTPEEQFQRLEQQWMDALAQRDSVLLERLLSPNFTIIGVSSPADDPVGDRPLWLRNALRFPWPRHEVRVVHVQLVGNVAVVRCMLRGTYPPQSITPDGGTLQVLITDVWVRPHGDWQVLARHSSFPSAGR